MTTALPASSPNPASTTSAPSSSATTAPPAGAVPAQLPVRSYASATKTATPPTSAGASAHNAKSAANPQMNGTMAQGGSQPTAVNGTANGSADHSRKTSVVINAAGASGNYPNGGPVGQTERPAISFGSINAPGADSQAAPFQSQNASLPTPSRDPRVISPAHSPSPIPQPAASGGKPPTVGQHQGGLAFGQLPADTEIVSCVQVVREAHNVLT